MEILKPFIILILSVSILLGCGQQTMKDEGLETKDISDAATTTSTTESADGPPTISSVTPDNGSINVSVSTTITITFNESINDTGSIMTGGTSCTIGNYQISTSSSFNSSSCLSWSASPNKSNSRKTLTIQPNASLNSSTTYYMRVGNNQGDYDIKDNSNTAMSSEYTWSFTTQ
jgi:hypothetical protein